MKMKRSVERVGKTFFFTMFIVVASAPSLLAQCVSPETNGGYRTYYHNFGLNLACTQDWDLDRAELEQLYSTFSAYVSNSYGTLVIGDYFGATCEIPRIPHGEVVEAFCNWGRQVGPNAVRVENGIYTWGQMVNYIADHFGQGTVANLSNGTLGWEPGNTSAVQNAYDSEVLLVGAPLTFAGAPNDVLDKVLTCVPMDAEGNYCAAHVPNVVNQAEIGVPTNWYNNEQSRYFIARAGSSGGWSSGWPDEGLSGSFTTAITSGCVQLIADAISGRTIGGNFVDQLLDYVVSGCDRKGSPQDYALYEGSEYLTSYGPWSPTWGYGQFNPWKALIYAYGWGVLEAKDKELDPTAQNPETVFSDDFELRGDLVIPLDQTLRVSPLATVAVADVVPEGPSDLGVFPDLQEILVAGELVVETSRTAPMPYDVDGVSSTIVVDDGGVCTVVDGGKIVVLPGQYLMVQEGGTLDVQEGGAVVVVAGGHLVVNGAFTCSGTLTFWPGSELEFGDGSMVVFNSGLTIPSGASVEVGDGGTLLVLDEFNSAGTLTLLSGSVTVFANNTAVAFSTDFLIPAGATVTISQGSTVTMAAGKKIDCSGTLQTNGTAMSPVMIHGATSGAGSWLGIVINTLAGSNNALAYTGISDATVGVNVSGSTQPLLSMSYLNVHDCVTGVKIAGRNNLTMGYGEFTNCTTAVELSQSGINITDASIHDNYVGVKCTNSSPKIRSCEIYKNHIGIHTANASSIPNVGTSVDPGNNNFFGPSMKYPGRANDVHISAFDPSNNIYAQKNWWGTTNTSLIQQRILVIDSPPAGCGSVVFVPVLSGPPVGAVSEPPIDVTKETRDVLNLTPGTVPGMTTYLGQNRPNPFNPTTTIEYGLGERSQVNLEIYDAAGRLVRVLVNEERGEGVYNETWDGMDGSGRKVASGVYFYRLTTNSLVETRKMLLLK